MTERLWVAQDLRLTSVVHMSNHPERFRPFHTDEALSWEEYLVVVINWDCRHGFRFS